MTTLTRRRWNPDPDGVTYVKVRPGDARFPYWSSATLTIYEVHVDGRMVGFVYSVRGTSHRKAGRIIMSTSHPTDWGMATDPGDVGRHAAACSMSRSDAARRLLHRIDRDA